MDVIIVIVKKQIDPSFLPVCSLIDLRNNMVKLEAYGFSDLSLELMRSCFTKPKNFVKTNNWLNMTSTWKDQLRVVRKVHHSVRYCA